MKIDFGAGPTLKQLAPWLEDDGARHAFILEVTERDSVIEGLPAFNLETRSRILAQLQSIAAQSPAPAE